MDAQPNFARVRVRVRVRVQYEYSGVVLVQLAHPTWNSFLLIFSFGPHSSPGPWSRFRPHSWYEHESTRARVLVRTRTREKVCLCLRVGTATGADFWYCTSISTSQYNAGTVVWGMTQIQHSTEPLCVQVEGKSWSHLPLTPPPSPFSFHIPHLLLSFPRSSYKQQSDANAAKSTKLVRER